MISSSSIDSPSDFSRAALDGGPVSATPNPTYFTLGFAIRLRPPGKFLTHDARRLEAALRTAHRVSRSGAAAVPRERRVARSRRANRLHSRTRFRWHRGQQPAFATARNAD